MIKKIIDEILLTALKEKAQLYVYGAGLTNNQQNKKDYNSMKYYIVLKQHIGGL